MKGLEPSIFALGERRGIHFATRAVYSMEYVFSILTSNVLTLKQSNTYFFHLVECFFMLLNFQSMINLELALY